MKRSLGLPNSLRDLESFPLNYFPLFLCIDNWGRLSYLSLLFFGTLHSDAYIFPFHLCFSLLFFSQLFVRPPQTVILLFWISFPWAMLSKSLIQFSVDGWSCAPSLLWTSLVALAVKCLSTMRETWVWSLGQEDSPGEGNGKPFQFSCLENSMDRGAWYATVHGIAKIRTWLRDFTFTFFHFSNLQITVKRRKGKI